MKAATKKTNKAVAYIRVSTGKQDLSMEAQEERIKLYCQMMGLELVEVIRERAVSAKIKLVKRPEGSKVATPPGQWRYSYRGVETRQALSECCRRIDAC